MKINTSIFVLLCLFYASYSHAALTANGNGTVKDTIKNIDWVQDANLVKTSCDANNTLWQAFDPTQVANNSGRSKNDICNDNGTLNWFEADVWIALLNTQAYKGYINWRQPDTNQPDLSCSQQVAGLASNPNQGFGSNCTNSELAYLFNVSLGNPNDEDNSCFGAVPHCFQNTAVFTNSQSFPYWSNTTYAPATTRAWTFSTSLGHQGTDDKDLGLWYVWPVRTSPTTPAYSIPTMSTWVIITLSIILGLFGRRHSKIISRS